MRSLLVLAPALAIALAIPTIPTVDAVALVHMPDGLTALLVPSYGIGYELMAPSPGGLFHVKVSTFEKTGSVWAQSADQVTLRLAQWDAPTQSWVSLYSSSLTTPASGATDVTFPSSTFSTPGPFDMWVTYYRPAALHWPTSHHSSAKNYAIREGLFDAADLLDHEGPVYPVTFAVDV